jgi:uncharacterized delta-60 repeat protein
VQGDGKIVIGGHSYQGGSTGWDFAVGRLNSDGTPDTTFDGDGKATIDFFSTSDYGRSVAVQADGKIVIGGQSYRSSAGWDFAVARLNSDGTLDTTFDGDGKVHDRFQFDKRLWLQRSGAGRRQDRHRGTVASGWQPRAMTSPSPG